MDLDSFKKMVWDYYKTNGRKFPWRYDPTPYQVLVSEIMLQQTQTERVIPKYNSFMLELPTLKALAQASSYQVLALWQGLGYNRRGLALHAIAQEICTYHGGVIPNDPVLLQKFKGIGPATAASICAFAYNKPTVFIETNIRAVFINSFFSDREKVHDKELFALVQITVDQENPREWYYALMDYGVMLKKTHKNPARKSAHHTKQSRFEGSERQIRGIILRLLVEHLMLNVEEIIAYSMKEETRVIKNLEKLAREGIVKQTNSRYYL